MGVSFKIWTNWFQQGGIPSPTHGCFWNIYADTKLYIKKLVIGFVILTLYEQQVILRFKKMTVSIEWLVTEKVYKYYRCNSWMFWICICYNNYIQDIENHNLKYSNIRVVTFNFVTEYGLWSNFTFIQTWVLPLRVRLWQKFLFTSLQ